MRAWRIPRVSHSRRDTAGPAAIPPAMSCGSKTRILVVSRPLAATRGQPLATPGRALFPSKAGCRSGQSPSCPQAARYFFPSRADPDAVPRRGVDSRRAREPGPPAAGPECHGFAARSPGSGRLRGRGRHPRPMKLDMPADSGDVSAESQVTWGMPVEGWPEAHLAAGGGPAIFSRTCGPTSFVAFTAGRALSDVDSFEWRAKERFHMAFQHNQEHA